MLAPGNAPPLHGSIPELYDGEISQPKQIHFQKCREETIGLGYQGHDIPPSLACPTQYCPALQSPFVASSYVTAPSHAQSLVYPASNVFRGPECRRCLQITTKCDLDDHAVEADSSDGATAHRRPYIPPEALPVVSKIFGCLLVQRVGGIGLEEEEL